MKRLEEMTFEELTEHILELRTRADRAEAELFAGVWLVENSEVAMRKITDAMATFESWAANQCLVNLKRYSRFRAGLERLGNDPELAVSLGAEAVIAAERIKSSEAVPRYTEAVTAWQEEKSLGSAHARPRPSMETARRLVSQVDPRAEVPRSVQRKTLVAELKEEAQKLRARVRDLEAENRKLRAKIERLSGSGAPKRARQGASRKTTAKSPAA